MMEDNESSPKMSYKEETTQKLMNSATQKSLGLIQKNCSLESQLEEKRHKIQTIEKEISSLIEQKRDNDINLEKQNKRFHILTLIKDYYNLIEQLQLSFTKRDYNSIYTLLKEIQNKSPQLKQQQAFNQIKEESKQKIQLLFSDLVIFKELSISFPNPQKFITFEKILVFLDSKEAYEKFISDSILSISLPAMNNKNCTVSETTLGSNPSINLRQGETPHTPATALKESCNLLSFLQKNLEMCNFQLSDEFLSKYADTAVELSMQHTGGRSKETEECAKQLSKLTKVGDIDLMSYAQKSRVPVTLAECRTMLKEGKLFGEAVKRMKDIFEGAPSEGILTKLTVMALVEWKNEPEKLRSAFSVFIAIGTDEALQCMMMFQKRLQELQIE